MTRFIKLVTFVICFVLTFITFIGVKANSNVSEFDDLSINTTKIRDNGNIKVEIELEFFTLEKIEIIQVSSEISGQSQFTMSPNSSWELVDKNGTQMYKYQLIYIVEFWQIGTMNLTIEYQNMETGEIGVKNIFIPGGKWISNEVSLKTAITFGIFATILIGIGSYIVIEYSKKGNFDSRK